MAIMGPLGIVRPRTRHDADLEHIYSLSHNFRLIMTWHFPEGRSTTFVYLSAVLYVNGPGMRALHAGPAARGVRILRPGMTTVHVRSFLHEHDAFL